MPANFILLFSSSTGAKVYETFSTLEDCFECLLSGFENTLIPGMVSNPLSTKEAPKELYYDATDFMTYLDNMSGILILSLETTSGDMYAPKGIDWVRNRFYRHMQERAVDK